MRPLILLSVYLVSALAHAYPEMVRHGYVNCTTCHLAPNGGGVLTAYGRGLSEEVLSTWKFENEAKFAYGLVTPPEWLHVGGDLRFIQTFRETQRVREGRLILMQADAEAAVTHKAWQALATAGYQDGFLSRRHYLLYRPADELAIRAGKFLRAYGINLPDHVVATKRGLGMDQGTETYNVELSWLGDNVDAFATAVLGRPDKKDLQRETGASLRSSLALGDSSKVGVSYFHGGNDRLSRHTFGPFAILGFTPRFFALAELDFESNFNKTNERSIFGLVSYLRLNYEVFRGGHLFVTHELSRLDFKSNARWADIYGVGAQWFPRPHIEFQVVYQKHKFPGAPTEEADFAWLMTHFYP